MSAVDTVSKIPGSFGHRDTNFFHKISLSENQITSTASENRYNRSRYPRPRRRFGALRKHIPAGNASQLAAVVAGRDSAPQLSLREQHVMSGICEGVPLKGIGKQFGVDARTVSTYRVRVLKKLQATTNAELIQHQG
jgi:DNA-binding NarL/FixJ family response regulator